MALESGFVMLKKTIMIFFSALFVVAVYLYFSKDETLLRENIKTQQVKAALVELKSFEYFKYQDSELVGTVAADHGHFFEPNLGELNGNVKTKRFTDKGIEYVNSESMTAIFEANSFQKLLKESTIRKAELIGFVEVAVKDHLLTTDYAEYIHKEQLIQSKRPVRVTAPNRVMSSDLGFEFDVQTEDLELIGSVSGVVESNAKARN